jgi:hypothetical protein
MIKKELRFEDFDGNLVVETHYFHLSKSELIDMEMSAEEGMSDKYMKLLNAGNAGEIISAFKDIISRAYGQRVPGNGVAFNKSPQISENFMNSPAFDALFTELMTSETAAGDFVSGLIPNDLAAQGAAEAKRVSKGISSAAGSPSSLQDQEDELSGLSHPRNANYELLPWAFRDPTQKEQMGMSREQLVDVMHRIASGWEPRV